ncbi:MAG: hypothetical protein ACFE7S_04960 [Candidatus Hodarchaeota archaeon]
MESESAREWVRKAKKLRVVGQYYETGYYYSKAARVLWRTDEKKAREYYKAAAGYFVLGAEHHHKTGSLNLAAKGFEDAARIFRKLGARDAALEAFLSATRCRINAVKSHLERSTTEP